MAITDSLRILITANGAQAEREFQKVGAAARTNLGHAETSAQQFGRSLTSAGVAMVAFGGVALVGLYKAAQAAQEEDLAITKLNTAFQNSPVLVGASTDALVAQAEALQDTTTYSDDATINMQALLATFRLTSEEIQGLTPLVQDLASFWGTDLDTAAKQVGKALQGNIGALQRSGVQIDEAAFATDRYSAVMTALRENAGGFAAAEGRTFNGQLTIMKNNLGDISEGIGRGAVQAFNSLLGPVKSVSDAFQKLSPDVQSAVGKVATFGAAALVAGGAAATLAGKVIQVRAAHVALQTATAAATTASGGVATGMAAVSVAAVAATAAVAAAAVGLAVWGHSMTGAQTDMEDFVAATDTGMRDTAELMAAVFSDSDIEDALSDMFAVDPAKTERFAEMLVTAGADADVVAGAMGELESAARLAALGLDDSATAAEELAGQIDSVVSSIDAYLGRVQGVEAAAAAEAEAQQALFEALVKNGNTFDVNTAAGRENIAMRQAWEDTVAGQVQAALEHGEATGRMGRAQGEANAAIRNGIQDLRDAHAQGLITEDQMEDYIRTIRNIPHRWETDVQVDNRQALNAIREARRRGEEFAAMTYEAQLSYVILGNPTGSRYGRGSPSDNATGGPLSAGEVSWVGERGPELFVSGRGGRIVPNNAIGVGGGGPSAEEIGRAVAEHLRKQPLMTVGVG